MAVGRIKAAILKKPFKQHFVSTGKIPTTYVGKKIVSPLLIVFELILTRKIKKDGDKVAQLSSKLVKI